MSTWGVNTLKNSRFKSLYFNTTAGAEVATVITTEFFGAASAATTIAAVIGHGLYSGYAAQVVQASSTGLITYPGRAVMVGELLDVSRYNISVLPNIIITVDGQLLKRVGTSRYMYL